MKPPERSRSTWYVWVFACLAGLSAAVPYAQARRKWPGEPASVSVIYRHPSGDIQYFPMVAALARGEFGEFTLKEEAGTGVWSFPFASLAWHAAGFALSGKYGFALADMAVTTAYYLLLVALYRTAGVSLPLCAVWALLAASHLAPTLEVWLPRLPPFQPVSSPWGDRFPRPFVSEVYTLAALVALARLAIKGIGGPRSDWVCLGAALSLTVQSDIYTAMTLLGVAGIVALRDLWRRDDRARGNVVAAAITLALLSTPFVLQRLWEHPDLPVRFGVFSVPRLRPLFSRNLLTEAAPRLAALAAAYGLLRAFSPEVDRTFGVGRAVMLRRLLGLFMGIVVLAYAALPVSTVVLGKAIQIYHFLDAASKLSAYATTVCFLLGLDFVGRNLLPRLARISLGSKPMAAFALAFLSLVVINLRAKTGIHSAYADHLRRDVHGELSNLDPTPYRTEFAGLIRHLTGVTSRERPVLATFDPMIYSWWLTFGGGYSYLADSFVSCVPDRTVESRLAVFCRLIGMSREEFEAHLRKPQVQRFWFGANKYQASRAHAFAPIGEYDGAVQREIRSGSIHNNWHTVVPSSEVERLGREFERVTPADFSRRELDVIVLTNDASMAAHSPPAGDWDLSFKSPRFRVYRRKP